MSKIYTIFVILLLGQPGLLFAGETPDANDGGGVLPLASGTYSGLIETTYDSPNWVLVLSELILREDLCVASGPFPESWYEKVFNPCNLEQGVPTKNNYWGLVSCAEPGQSFPLSEISNPDWYTLDSLYIREGVGFQLYGPDEQPYGPYMAGPKYVSIDFWRDINPTPDGFEPGTFFVHGHDGALEYYSIIIYPKPLELTKNVLDEPNCVSPYDYINYTICYTPVDCEHTGLQVIDHLPGEVDFVNAIPDTGVYDPCNHTYTWDLGDITGGDPNCLELIVEVNRHARPLEQIVNKVKAKSDTSLMVVKEETLVCQCGDYGDIIRVDIDVDATEPDGSTWQAAYKYLQDALTAALPCDEIWVADGEYKPSDPNAFQLGHSVRIYGGFIGGPTGEENRYERNWFDNETILNGQIGEDNADYVVSISDANAFNVIDGFTIKGGNIAGIYCDDVSAIVGHNKIMDNGVGMYCHRTKRVVAKNNWIYKNNYGLYFESPADVTVVRNNTIADNNEVGIYLEDGTEPQISNCIFSGHPAGYGLVGCGASYSYIDYGATGEGNIEGDPNYPPFVEGDDDYHLELGSSCIDAGDPNGDYTGERDIDKHFRVLDGDGVDGKRVDMGADEYCNEGDENDADFNNDYIVDTNDLRELAAAWLIDDSDPCWATNYDKYDLNTDDVINYGDFAYFAQEWLWMTCEKMQGYEMMEMMMGMGSGMGRMAGAESMLISEPAAEQQVSETQPEPSVAEQIEQIKYLLDWLYEIKDEVDEDTWLGLVTILEEILKDLQDSQ